MEPHLTNNYKRMRTVKIKSNYSGWFYDAMVWCQKYCTGKHNITPAYIEFEKPEDAVFYALTHE